MKEIEVYWLWIYVAVMAAGAFYFASLSFQRKGVPRIEYLVAFIIPVWSGTAYASMAVGQGIVDIGEKVTYYARYLDWVVTTPLLLVALSMTGMFYIRKDKVIILGLVAADVFMILTGLIADLTSSWPLRYMWYTLGLVALLLILWIIWYPLRHKAQSQGRELASLYDKAAGYLSILWVCYPTIWLIGPSGIGLVGQVTDTVLFVILPIFSKVGFSILDLNGLRALKKSPDSNPLTA
ncbi:bacteriorhodopsin [Marinicrinis sediminis]|uniref:Bacteriorhodopsin n=1 Tax=Marinicrinis sediminis TaxID=1652465 RepID=A0ABW5RAS0_9BACL